MGLEALWVSSVQTGGEPLSYPQSQASPPDSGAAASLGPQTHLCPAPGTLASRLLHPAGCSGAVVLARGALGPRACEVTPRGTDGPTLGGKEFKGQEEALI